MRISDWSSDVCSSDLRALAPADGLIADRQYRFTIADIETRLHVAVVQIDAACIDAFHLAAARCARWLKTLIVVMLVEAIVDRIVEGDAAHAHEPVAVRDLQVGRQSTAGGDQIIRSEEHTSELQSLMRISYAVFCLKKKKT